MTTTKYFHDGEMMRKSKGDYPPSNCIIDEGGFNLLLEGKVHFSDEGK